MVGIRGELPIARPVDEVFDEIAERNVHDRRITLAQLLTEEPVRVGTWFRTEMVKRSRRTR